MYEICGRFSFFFWAAPLYKCLQIKSYRDVFHSLFLKPPWYLALRDKVSRKRDLALTTIFRHTKENASFIINRTVFIGQELQQFFSFWRCVEVDLQMFVLFQNVAHDFHFAWSCWIKIQVMWISTVKKVWEDFSKINDTVPDFQDCNFGSPLLHWPLHPVTVMPDLWQNISVFLVQCVSQLYVQYPQILKRTLLSPCCYLHNENIKTRLHR